MVNPMITEPLVLNQLRKITRAACNVSGANGSWFDSSKIDSNNQERIQCMAVKYDCFNCGDEITACQCGDTETYENQEGPVCPYCGTLAHACDSDGALYSEMTDTYDCEQCGKTFNVSVSVTFSWSATRRALRAFGG